MEISELYVNSEGKLIRIERELVLFRTFGELRSFLSELERLEDLIQENLIQSNRKKDGG